MGKSDSRICKQERGNREKQAEFFIGQEYGFELGNPVSWIFPLDSILHFLPFSGLAHMQKEWQLVIG